MTAGAAQPAPRREWEERASLLLSIIPLLDLAHHYLQVGLGRRLPVLFAAWAAFAVADEVLRRRAAKRSVIALRVAVWGGLVGYFIRHSPTFTLSALTVALLGCLGGVVDRRHRVGALVKPAYSLCLALMLLSLSDVVVWLCRGPERRMSGTYVTAGWSVPDPALGYRNRPGSCEARLEVGGRVAYEVRYQIDEAGRRVVDNLSGASRHLILAGCSYTFGEGVAGEAVAASHLAKLGRWQVYNYGSPGNGPQHVFTRIRSGALSDDVPEREGVFVYMALLPTHNDRLVGSHSTLRWLGSSPALGLRDGEVVTLGSFAQAEPVRVLISKLALGSPTLDVLATGYAASRSPRRDPTLFVAVARACRGLYLRQFAGRFVVGVWPDSRETPARREFTDEVVRRLRAERVEVLDLRDPPLAAGRQWFLPLDGHPAPALHELLARRLAERLSRAEPPSGPD